MSYPINTKKLSSSSTLMDHGDRDIPDSASRKGIEIKPIIIPILLILLSVSPGIGSGMGVTAGKAITGGLLLLLTFPAVAATFVNANKVKGRLIMMAFFLMTVLNVFVAMANHLSLSYWLRLGFGSYTFVATLMAVTYHADTPNRRHNLYIWLVIFLTLFSIYHLFFTTSPAGLEEAIEERSFGVAAGPLVAAMLILPAFGNLLLKSLWLSVGFYANILLLILGCSRTNYILLGIGFLYSILFIQRRFIKRFAYLIAVMILGVIFINIPGVYDQMAFRFEMAGKDESSLRRIDQARSAAAAVSENFQSLLFGKGYGTPYNVRYKLANPYSSLAKKEIMPPHNDYACRLLYCGVTGLIVQLLLFLIFGKVFGAAIKRFGRDNIDPYAQVRVHGAMLVLIAMAVFGLAGGNFYLWNNDIFLACALGLGLAEATEILSNTKRVSL
jgi:hypothetical protein